MRIDIDYDFVAKFYDGLSIFFEWFLSIQRKKILLQTKRLVLEVGAGTGNSFKNYPAGKQIIAIDSSGGMLRIAKNKCRSDCSAYIDLQISDVQTLPFKNETFDTVFVSLVFCSVHKPFRGLGEIRRVLKSNGCLLMIEHVKSGNSLIGFLMEKFNPLVAKFDNIDRETVYNVELAGFRIEREVNVFFDVLKCVVASKQLLE